MATQPVVLLVEDHEPLRKVLGRLLAKRGIEVVQAANGAEGLARLFEFGDRLRLVITDHQMPHVPGDVFAEAVRQIRPDLPIIRMSGGIDDCQAFTDGMPRSRRVAYLAKPFDVKRFESLVQRFLAESDAGRRAVR